MTLISDVQYYVPIKLCKTARSIHLFKISGTLSSEYIKLNKNYIWDTLEIDCKEVNVTFNDNKINLPRTAMIKLKDKIKIRCIMKREPLLFHVMLKQGIHGSHWLPGNKKLYKTIKVLFQMALCSNARMQISFTNYFQCLLPEETIDVEVKITSMRGIQAFRRDCTTQIIKCKPWSPRLHQYPSLA